MIDVYIVVFLIILSTLLIIVDAILILFRSFILSKYLKSKSVKLYEAVHGIVNGPLGVPMRDNLSYWKWVFLDTKHDDKTLIKHKQALRRFIFVFLTSLSLITISSIYLYVRFNIMSVK